MPTPEELERDAAAAWPAEVVVARDGWLLRATPGVTGRRLNSALPLAADPAVEVVCAFYASLGLVSRVAVAPAGAYERLGQGLADRGWRREAPTVVLTRPAEALAGRASGVDVVAPDAWARAWRELGDAARTAEPRATAVLERMAHPCLPLVARRNGVVVGVALAVLRQRTSVVFSVAVAPEHRRHGVATDLMRAWASLAGDRTLFLQVLEDNAAALAFYDRLGFTPSHRYHYRTAPA